MCPAKIILTLVMILIHSFQIIQADQTPNNKVIKKCSSRKAVCGSDGKTYQNICYLQNNNSTPGIKMAYEGECKKQNKRRKLRNKKEYRPDLILKSKAVNAADNSLQKKLVKHFNPITGKWEYVVEILPTIVITPTFHHLRLTGQNNQIWGAFPHSAFGNATVKSKSVIIKGNEEIEPTISALKKQFEVTFGSKKMNKYTENGTKESLKKLENIMEPKKSDFTNIVEPKGKDEVKMVTKSGLTTKKTKLKLSPESSEMDTAIKNRTKPRGTTKAAWHLLRPLNKELYTAILKNKQNKLSNKPLFSKNNASNFIKRKIPQLVKTRVTLPTINTKNVLTLSPEEADISIYNKTQTNHTPISNIQWHFTVKGTMSPKANETLNVTQLVNAISKPSRKKNIPKKIYLKEKSEIVSPKLSVGIKPSKNLEKILPQKQLVTNIEHYLVKEPRKDTYKSILTKPHISPLEHSNIQWHFTVQGSLNPLNSKGFKDVVKIPSTEKPPKMLQKAQIPTRKISKPVEFPPKLKIDSSKHVELLKIPLMMDHNILFSKFPPQSVKLQNLITKPKINHSLNPNNNWNLTVDRPMKPLNGNNSYKSLITISTSNQVLKTHPNLSTPQRNDTSNLSKTFKNKLKLPSPDKLKKSGKSNKLRGLIAKPMRELVSVYKLPKMSALYKVLKPIVKHKVNITNVNHPTHPKVNISSIKVPSINRTPKTRLIFNFKHPLTTKARLALQIKHSLPKLSTSTLIMKTNKSLGNVSISQRNDKPTCVKCKPNLKLHLQIQLHKIHKFKKPIKLTANATNPLQKSIELNNLHKGMKLLSNLEKPKLSVTFVSHPVFVTHTKLNISSTSMKPPINRNKIPNLMSNRNHSIITKQPLVPQTQKYLSDVKTNVYKKPNKSTVPEKMARLEMKYKITSKKEEAIKPLNKTLASGHPLNWPITWNFTPVMGQNKLKPGYDKSNAKKIANDNETPVESISNKNKWGAYHLKLPNNVADYLDFDVYWNLISLNPVRSPASLNITEEVVTKKFTWNNGKNILKGNPMYTKFLNAELQQINRKVVKEESKSMVDNSNSSHAQYLGDENHQGKKKQFPIKANKIVVNTTYQLNISPNKSFGRGKTDSKQKKGLVYKQKKGLVKGVVRMSPLLRQFGKSDHLDGNVERKGKYQLEIPGNIAKGVQLIFTWSLRNKIPKTVQIPINVTENKLQYTYKWDLGGNLVTKETLLKEKPLSSNITIHVINPTSSKINIPWKPKLKGFNKHLSKSKFYVPLLKRKNNLTNLINVNKNVARNSIQKPGHDRVEEKQNIKHTLKPESETNKENDQSGAMIPQAYAMIPLFFVNYLYNKADVPETLYKPHNCSLVEKYNYLKNRVPWNPLPFLTPFPPKANK